MLWWLRIVALNGVAGIVDMLYAIEGAYFIPAIYDKGLSSTYGSMLLCLSPILGVLFQSYLGSASDQCKCRWGKRRPFILALSITCICGLVLFPFTENIADLLTGERLQFVVLLILIMLATTLTDFSIGALQTPSRAYLLDVLPVEHTKFGNIICSIWISIGASVGFGLGAIDWSSDFSLQVKIVCGLSLIITVICVVLTLLSVKEQNPQLKIAVKTEQGQILKVSKGENGKTLKQPTDFQQENTITSTNRNLELTQVAKETLLTFTTNEDSHKTLKEATVTGKPEYKGDNKTIVAELLSVTTNDYENAWRKIEIQTQCAQRMKYLSIDDLTIIPYEGCITNTNDHTDCGCGCANGFVSSVVGNIKFIRYMSLPTVILWFAHFFGCLAIAGQLFFFTDYVAEVIYNGDVTAPENSTAYQRYTEGVRIGSLALGVSAFFSLAASLCLGPIMKLFGMRLVYVSSYVFSMLQTGVMIFSRNVIVLFVLSPALYYLIIILLTIPYILVSEYATQSILIQKAWPYSDRNLIGRACSILIIALLSSQVASLIIIGLLKNLYAESVMIFISASSFVGAVIACFVIVPYKKSKKKRKCTNLPSNLLTVTDSKPESVV